MGQYLPEVRGVFNLIKKHKKDLEAEVKIKRQGQNKLRQKVKRA